ncbi:hypothetical protein C8C83_0516 [Flavobacterium sp. 90]|uniref:hypothetical protein n=1 Tax=unclassified Flavobacterium TaxID=196869 RepID=UPI000F2C1B64|nr:MULTISPECIES: hypothetical protein [unclassified Flavobacterium]RKR08921.1 hypothetical protein C8C82_0811 [Flavobacterium sp. 81]TCK52709.1 hypothetical protein C8C83_0516 [Flavobacterium sp. 90]
MIQIEDKNGENVEVANLTQAIEQADYFRNFAHSDKLFEKFDKKQQAYWQDMYEKLVAISDLDVEQTKE